MTTYVQAGEGFKLAEQTVKTYQLCAYRLPYYESTLEFIQVNHPDGTSSYFRQNGDIFEAGPFGGGYSWTVPKYIITASQKMFREVFPPTETEPETTT